MSSTGAIPKGARPKTAKISSQDSSKQQNTNSSVNKQNVNELLGDPLEIKEVYSSVDDIQIKRAALNSFWVEQRVYIPFTMPPQPDSNDKYTPGAAEAWIEQIEFIIEDLSWVLGLPHHKFWSQVIYDRSLHDCLESYLSGRSRWYEDNIPIDTFSSYLDSIHNLIFLIYVRMATFKESKHDHITPSVFAHLIYQNFLFDVCKLIDLSALYGPSNGSLLKKMLENIFIYQPKYHNDLADFISSLKKVLDNVEDSLGLSKLSMCLSSEFKKLSINEVNDTIEYIIDIFCSLEAFLSLFPNGAEAFRSSTFDIRLATFYEKTIPFLATTLTNFSEIPENELWVINLVPRLNLARLSCISVFRGIVENCCFSMFSSSVSQDKVSTNMEACIENFTHTFTTCVEEKTFITDYNSTFSIEKDIQMFSDCGADMTTLNFVQEAVNSVVMDVMASSTISTDNNVNFNSKNNSPSPPILENNPDDSSGMNGYYSGETLQISQVEVASLVSNIKDLLPDLGSGFIKECLVYYNYSTEEVLNAILENNLAPMLQSVPRDKELIEEVPEEPVAPLNKKMEVQKELPKESDHNGFMSRQNIYDDDEFDVFSKKSNLNLNNIHKGKKKDYITPDSSFQSKMKEISHQYDSNFGYSIYEEELKYLPIQVKDYEDEYDDTYDDNEAGNLDDFTLDKRKPSMPTLRGTGALNTPGLDFMGTPTDESQDENSSEEKEEADGGQRESKVPPAHLVDSKEIKEFSGQFRRPHQFYQGGKPNKKNVTVFENSRNKRGQHHRDSPHVNGVVDTNSQEANNDLASEDEKKKKPGFEPFCDNPAEMRRRAEERRYSRMERKRNFRFNGPPPPPQDSQFNHSQEVPPTHSKGRGGANKSHRGNARNPGRQFQNGEAQPPRQPHQNSSKREDSSGPQDNYRYKTAHKNQDRRRGAQAKYRGGFS